MTKLRLAVPSKGRMSEEVVKLLSDSGLRVDTRTSDRALSADIGNDIEAIFVRAKDIPEFVADGTADVGITGLDLLKESGRDLACLVDLEVAPCRLAVAVTDSSPVRSIDAIEDGARVATSFPRTTQRFFASKSKKVEIVCIAGSAEIAPHLGVADVVVDLVQTGSTLRVNRLAEIATILESSAQLISLPGRASDCYELVSAVESVLKARGKRYVMANIPRSILEKIERVLPGINGPTVTGLLGDDDRVAIHAVVEQELIYKTVADLKSLGAEGVLVTQIERFA